MKKSGFIRFKISILILSVLITLVPLSNSLALGTSSEWAKSAISEMTDKKMIPNYLKDKNLQEDITRLEYTYLAIAYYNYVSKIISFPSKNESPFKDTLQEFPILAYKLGLIEPHPDGTFKGNDKITRQEIVEINNRLEKKLTDVRDDMLLSEGKIGIDPDKNYIATETVSRQEAIAIINNLSNKLGIKDLKPNEIPFHRVTPEEIKQKQDAIDLYIKTMDEFPSTTRGWFGNTKYINTFKVIDNGTPFVGNGIKVNKVKVTHNNNWSKIELEQESPGSPVSNFASFYLVKEGRGVWVSQESSFPIWSSEEEKNSQGIWSINHKETNDVVAALFYTGDGNQILVKLKDIPQYTITYPKLKKQSISEANKLYKETVEKINSKNVQPPFDKSKMKSFRFYNHGEPFKINHSEIKRILIKDYPEYYELSLDQNPNQEKITPKAIFYGYEKNIVYPLQWYPIDAVSAGKWQIKKDLLLPNYVIFDAGDGNYILVRL